MSTETKKSKRGRGRPKLAKQDKRSRIVMLRVKDDDYKRFVKAAMAKDQTVSDWIRERVGIVEAE